MRKMFEDVGRRVEESALRKINEVS